MEEKEQKSVLKTPRRTRRTSVLESQKSPTGLTEIGENNAESVTKLDPVTPGRSTRPLDFRTPSRSEALSSVQTPRRSCRKSIKPIQEYENIVAQKGLSVKRLITEPTPSEEVEEEATSTTTASELRENKWTPADIGRVSSKRSKKKRNKAKRLARQKNVVAEEDEKMEVEEVGKADENLDHNHLEHDEIEVEKEEPKIDGNSVPMETEAEEEKKEIDAEIPPADEVAPEIQIEKITPAPAESEDSMDGGDVILNAMPITGDDYMQSPEKPFNQHFRNSIPASPVAESVNLVAEPDNPVVESANHIPESAASVADSTNKSNDSDCIMLSLNESSQSRQSLGLKSSSFAAETKSAVDVSSDSFGASMPPLLVCSDDEDDEPEFVDAQISPDGGDHFELAIEEEHCDGIDEPDPLNGTFTSRERDMDKEEGGLIGSEMSLQEEKEKPIDIVFSSEEIRKIVLGIEEIPDDPKDDPQVLSPNDETFDADKSPIQLPHTPSHLSSESSINRILTPFKSDKKILPDIVIEPEEEEFEDTPKFVYEANKHKLKSSRKRSFSFCVDRPKKNVTFHSPSNTTININRDEMTRNADKNTPINITKRRKRSLSVTETDRDLLDYIQMKKPSQDTTPKKKLVHQSKIKMPNFSNIHQKQFQRMESITDHVARRAERAKILINSSSKIRPASVQKGLPTKNSVLRDHNKNANKTQLPVPKARHRIDMSQIETKSKADIENNLQIGAKFRSKSKQDLRPLDDLQVFGKTPTKATSTNTTTLFKQNNTNKLPKQKFNFNFNSTTVPTCGNTMVTSVPQRVHLPNPRENFNLNTVITSTKQSPKGDKLEDRRKRMMEMFKSKSSQRAATNKKEILKGVRTNRRFELQMLCRNRQN